MAKRNPKPPKVSKKKYYKHPWKSCSLSLVVPNIAEKRAGLSVELRDKLFETEDPKIQKLLEARPEFHPGGIEEITKELFLRIKIKGKTSGPRYQEGVSRVLK